MTLLEGIVNIKATHFPFFFFSPLKYGNTERIQLYCDFSITGFTTRVLQASGAASDLLIRAAWAQTAASLHATVLSLSLWHNDDGSITGVARGGSGNAARPCSTCYITITIGTVSTTPLRPQLVAPPPLNAPSPSTEADLVSASASPAAPHHRSTVWAVDLEIFFLPSSEQHRCPARFGCRFSGFRKGVGWTEGGGGGLPSPLRLLMLLPSVRWESD